MRGSSMDIIKCVLINLIALIPISIIGAIGAKRKFVTKQQLDEILYGERGFKPEIMNLINDCFNKKLDEVFGMVQDSIDTLLKNRLESISVQNLALEKQIYDISKQLTDLSEKIVK
jgi:hypothetical protein